MELGRLVYQQFQQPLGMDHEVHTLPLHILQIRGVEMGTNPHVPIHHSMFLIAYSIGGNSERFFREIKFTKIFVEIISRKNGFSRHYAIAMQLTYAWACQDFEYELGSLGDQLIVGRPKLPRMSYVRLVSCFPKQPCQF